MNDWEAPLTDDEDGAPNLTPLIDIVFILLIFFVVTASFARDLGFEVTRPTATTGTQQDPRKLRVALGRGGEITVDGRPTSPWRVEVEVTERLSHFEDKEVLVIADAAVDAKRLVEVMDRCRRAGATNIALAVAPP